MSKNETRLGKLEDHAEKTDPGEIRVFVYWYSDDPDWVEFTPPGASGKVRMSKRDFEEKYTPEQRFMIEVCYIDRPAEDDPDIIHVKWPEDDAWPDDDAED